MMRSRSAGSVRYCSRAMSNEASASTWPLSRARIPASCAPAKRTSRKKVFGSRSFTSPRWIKSTIANSSPVARRSVGFCEGVRTRCRPSAAPAASGAMALGASVHNASNARVRAIIGGECTIETPTMRVLRPGFFWALVFVAAAAGGIYLADRLVLAPGRLLQRQLEERDAQIRALTERNQALEAAVRLPPHAPRPARPGLLGQAPGPRSHPRTRRRVTELHAQGDPA